MSRPAHLAGRRAQRWSRVARGQRRVSGGLPLTGASTAAHSAPLGRRRGIELSVNPQPQGDHLHHRRKARTQATDVKQRGALYCPFGIQVLSLFDTTRLASEHDQPHMRSPFFSRAAPISRLRRARLRRTKPFLLSGFQARGRCGSFNWIHQDVRLLEVTEFGLLAPSSLFHNGTFNDDASGYIFPKCDE